MERIDLINQRIREIDSRLAQLERDKSLSHSEWQTSADQFSQEYSRNAERVKQYNDGHYDFEAIRNRTASASYQVDICRNRYESIERTIHDLKEEKEYLEKCRTDFSLDSDWQAVKAAQKWRNKLFKYRVDYHYISRSGYDCTADSIKLAESADEAVEIVRRSYDTSPYSFSSGTASRTDQAVSPAEAKEYYDKKEEAEERARKEQKEAEEQERKEAEERAEYRFKVKYYHSGMRSYEYDDEFGGGTGEYPYYDLKFKCYTNRQDAKKFYKEKSHEYRKNNEHTPKIEEAPVGECYDTNGYLIKIPDDIRYSSALAGLLTAKAQINNNKQKSTYFAELSKEFDRIKQTLQSLPSSFDGKAQIQECVNYQKQCDEKYRKKHSQESRKKVFFAIIIIAVLTVAVLYIINRSSGKRPESELPVAAAISVTATVTSDALNFRSSPSSNAMVLKTLKKGDALTVIGDIDGDWIPVKHGSEHGYVNSKYVSIMED